MSDCPDCPHPRLTHWSGGCMACRCTRTEVELQSLGLAQGRALRDEGAALAADASGEWKDRASAWIERQPRGKQFTALDLTDAVGMPDGHVNAVGAVLAGAGKRKLTRNTGQYIQSSRRDRHAGRNAVWERL